MRKMLELEGLSKEQMTEDEYKMKESVIDRIISVVLHRGYKDPEGTWSSEVTDRLLVYQEDIMMLCQYGGGFTLSRADDVRRAMGKKKLSLMESFRDEFISGWKERIGPFSVEVWEKMVDYAKYCFNKSHAVCYTMITMKTAELCLPENRADFMLYNYTHANKPDKKAAAINHLLESARLKFPTAKRPFEGLKIIASKKSEDGPGIVEVKDCRDDLPEGAPELEHEYSSFAELFMADLGPSLKFRLICRGVYDDWCLDIRGLAKLNKAMGKAMAKYASVPSNAFPSEDLAGVIKVLDMQGKFEWVVETPEKWELKPVKNPRAKSEPEIIEIYKGNKLGSWPAEVTQYRTQQLKKQFSIIKKNGLTPYKDSVSELRDIAEKINNVLQRVRDQNPGVKINSKNFPVIMRKVPKLYDYFQNKKAALEAEVLTGYVADKAILKNGSCCLVFSFSNDYTPVKFFTKDPAVIQAVEKNSIVNFRVLINDTVWRGDFKVFTNVALV